ncbi:polymer-forming cytoskeletal protein [Candidatus Gracilibacteria bacterium]|nr:polymer-forming cytoskeletal protein [Candidatus Gracilibacteria bacterium]
MLGSVEGDVTNWSGTITIEGAVSGDVVSYGGTIVLGPQAEVGGHILALAGTIARADSARVVGAQLAPQLTDGAVLAGLPGFFGDNQALGEPTPIGVLPGVLVGGLVLLFTSLAALIWPRRLRTAAALLLQRPAHALGFGLLTAFLYAAIVFRVSPSSRSPCWVYRWFRCCWCSLSCHSCWAWLLSASALATPSARAARANWRYRLQRSAWSHSARLRLGSASCSTRSSPCSVFMLPLALALARSFFRAVGFTGSIKRGERSARFQPQGF